jgi:hypothetical protein
MMLARLKACSVKYLLKNKMSLGFLTKPILILTAIQQIPKYYVGVEKLQLHTTF